SMLGWSVSVMTTRQAWPSASLVVSRSLIVTASPPFLGRTLHPRIPAWQDASPTYCDESPCRGDKGPPMSYKGLIRPRSEEGTGGVTEIAAVSRVRRIARQGGCPRRSRGGGGQPSRDGCRCRRLTDDVF